MINAAYQPGDRRDAAFLAILFHGTHHTERVLQVPVYFRLLLIITLVSIPERSPANIII